MGITSKLPSLAATAVRAEGKAAVRVAGTAAPRVAEAADPVGRTAVVAGTVAAGEGAARVRRPRHREAERGDKWNFS